MIKQTMNTAIPADPNNVRAVVDEASDGLKAVPVELVTKAADDSTFSQVNDSNQLPIKNYVFTGSLWVPQKANDNGEVLAQLTGSYATIKSAPVTGVKTVTSIAAEIFAGASRLPGRRKMIIKNESTTMRIRLGSSTLNVQNGFPVEPTAIFEFDFDPNTAVAIYAISESGNVEVAVIEV